MQEIKLAGCLPGWTRWKPISKTKVHKRWSTKGTGWNCLEHASTGLESWSPLRVESGKGGEKQEGLPHINQQQEEHCCEKCGLTAGH